MYNQIRDPLVSFQSQLAVPAHSTLDFSARDGWDRLQTLDAMRCYLTKSIFNLAYLAYLIHIHPRYEMNLYQSTSLLFSFLTNTPI